MFQAIAFKSPWTWKIWSSRDNAPVAIFGSMAMSQAGSLWIPKSWRLTYALGLWSVSFWEFGLDANELYS